MSGIYIDIFSIFVAFLRSTKHEGWVNCYIVTIWWWCFGGSGGGMESLTASYQKFNSIQQKALNKHLMNPIWSLVHKNTPIKVGRIFNTSTAQGCIYMYIELFCYIYMYYVVVCRCGYTIADLLTYLQPPCQLVYISLASDALRHLPPSPLSPEFFISTEFLQHIIPYIKWIPQVF